MASAKALLESTYVIPEGSEESTFGLDDQLPSLPLPPLEATLAKYLESVKPFINQQEFDKTRQIVERFQNGEGKLLDQKLREKARKERNWLEEWWKEWSYLRVRSPLLPYVSMEGVIPVHEIPGWKTVGREDQISHAASALYATLDLWKLLRCERLKPTLSKDGTPFSMAQFRYLFNTVRLPGPQVDSSVSHFRTEKEGHCPVDVVVICRGRIFRFDGQDNDGVLLNAAEIKVILEEILVECEKKSAEFLVAGLTCDDRAKWSNNYAELKALSAKNVENLKIIERSIHVLSLDDSIPETVSQVHSFNLHGNYTNIWADKPTLIAYGNGCLGGLSDHTGMDGLVPVTLYHYIFLKNYDNSNNGGTDIRSEVAKFQEIVLDLNDNLKAKIRRIANAGEKENPVIVYSRYFENIGKNSIQKCKLHPDSFIQMALQLTYVRLHGRPAPCYETATTRSYYNGRTETVRSCTMECLQWVAAMLDKSASKPKRKELLIKAVDKHNNLMAESRQNSGCDRHLFGLYYTAVEEGLPIPEIYNDPSYSKSGGGGNFVLSTSLVGFTPVAGAVVPMCLDGYAVFYNILPEKFAITICVYTKSKEADPEKFYNACRQSLSEMLGLWECENSSQLKF